MVIPHYPPNYGIKIEGFDPSPGSRGSEPESIPAMALLASGFAGKSLFCIWACLGATGAQTRRNPTKWNTKCSCRPHIHTNPCFILSSNFRGKGRSISSSWYCFTCRNGKESPSNPVHVGNWTSSRSTCCSCCAWCCCLAPERLFSHQIHSASNRRGVLHQLELAVEKLLLILEFLTAVAAMRDDVSVLGHLGRQLCGAESCCKAIWSCFRLWMITSLPEEYEENTALDALVTLYPSWNIGPRRVRSSFMLSMLSSLEEHGEWVWVYIYEPMSMSSGSLSMWVCNAPLHRGQKRKIEKIALRYVCAGTGLKQAQRQRHDIHEYSLNYMIGLCQLRSSACDPFFSAAKSRARLGSFPKDLLVDWTFQTEHRTAGQTWLKQCWPESSKTCRFAVILILFMSMFLLSSLILFVLHLFVNIKDLTSCLANGRRDAQVEKSRKVENCFDFLRKVSLLSSKEEEVGSGTCLYLCYGTRPMLSSML